MADAKGAMHITSDDFDSTLTEAAGKDQPVFVDFYAEWCGPCKLAGPVVDKLAEEYDGKMVVAKLDVDNNNDIAARYGVMSIPTTIVFKKSDSGEMEEVDRKIGYPGEEGYREMLDAALAN